jgi:hypothetical protein
MPLGATGYEPVPAYSLHPYSYRRSDGSRFVDFISAAT